MLNESNEAEFYVWYNCLNPRQVTQKRKPQKFFQIYSCTEPN